MMAYGKFGIVLLMLAGLAACGGGSSSSSAVVPAPASSVTSSAASSSSDPDIEYASLAAELEAYLLREVAVDQPGVALLVMQSGEVVYQGGRGLANKQSGVAISGRTGFRLASVSKSFTALAVMQLVEMGQLQVTDSVRHYIPELSLSWQKITLEHLLSHQSGVPDVLTPFSFMDGMTNDQAVGYYADNPFLSFTPGSRTVYSNTNYVLLAEVVERASGYSFADYLRIHIFEPARMVDSYLDNEMAFLRSKDALNYADRTTFYNNLTAHLVGNMGQVSSTQDFVGFFNALRDNTLVSADTLALMTEGRGQIFGGDYGYGFMMFTDTYGHGGLFDGFRTEMTVRPATDLAFVILTNGGINTQSHLNALKEIIYRWDK